MANYQPFHCEGKLQIRSFNVIMLFFEGFLLLGFGISHIFTILTVLGYVRVTFLLFELE